jgi:NitT/TauT family transport system substrate-binding protein
MANALPASHARASEVEISRWTQASQPAEIAKTIEQFFPGINPQALVAGAERYRKLNLWKTTPVIDPKAIDRFQDILVQGNLLDPAKRVKFQDLVVAEFASTAQ